MVASLAVAVAQPLAIGSQPGASQAGNPGGPTKSSGIAEGDAARRYAEAYSSAEALVRSHDWDAAIAALGPLLVSRPGDLKLLNLLGLAYTGKGDRIRADRYFASAVKLDAKFVPALKNLAINELALGQIAEAKGHLLAAVAIAADDPVANLYLGEILYREREYASAMEHLKQTAGLVDRSAEALAALAVAELKTNHASEAQVLLGRLPPAVLGAESQFAVGSALAEAGLYDPAIAYLQGAEAGLAGETGANSGAVDGPPSTSKAATSKTAALDNVVYDLALCYLNGKRYDEAISLLGGRSEQHRASAEDEGLLAEAYEGSHQTQMAVDALRRAIALDPADDAYYLAFASLCIDHQDYPSAEKVLDVAVGLHPRTASLWFERAILNGMQDHYELAEKDFERAAELAPASNSAYVGLGVTYLETGEAAKAIPILRRRLHDHPDDAGLCYLLGEALVKTDTGQSAAVDASQDASQAEAQRYFERAIRLDPSLVEPHIALGTLYLRIGRTEDAVSQLEAAQRLDPQAKSAYAHLAIAYRRMGDPEKSKQVLAELKAINDRERAVPSAVR